MDTHYSPKFITLEGIEGVGKTTAMDFLEQTLTAEGLSVCVTREPGGTDIAEQIRHVLLSHQSEPMAPETELLLMFAGRAQHLAHKIKPALANQQWVLSDRFTDATYAYQGAGRAITDERIEIIENWVQGGLRPDAVILLDCPVEQALERAKRRRVLDRFEQEDIRFFTAVRECYLKRARSAPERYHIVDASLPLPEVTAQLDETLSRILQTATVEA